MRLLGVVVYCGHGKSSHSEMVFQSNKSDLFETESKFPVTMSFNCAHSGGGYAL